MKKSMKQCVCIGLALCMLWAGVGEVSAADHCGTTKVTCGGLVDNVSMESHQIFDVKGNTVTCQRRKELHFHTISCNGCGAVLKSNVVHACLIKHTICNAESGNCQNLR